MSSNNMISYLSCSRSALIQTALTWKIDNFSHRNTSLTSPRFTDEKKNEFYLRLSPNYDGFLNLYIYYPKLPYICQNIHYSLSLFDVWGTKQNIQDGFGKFSGRSCDTSIDILKFISREELFKNRWAYLPGDTLTIHCEIFRVADDKTSLSTVNGPSQESACKEKTLTDYGNLLKSGNLADVKLLVGAKTFSAHKLILSARSPVFAAMFAHDTKEKQESQVEIPEVNPEAFGKFLEYLYTGAMPILVNVKSAEELLVVSDKYDADQLKFFCEDFLATQMTIETAPNLLLLANSVNAGKLKESAIEFIRSHGNELFTAMQNEPEQMINMFQYLAVKNDDKKESK